MKRDRNAANQNNRNLAPQLKQFIRRDAVTKAGSRLEMAIPAAARPVGKSAGVKANVGRILIAR
jgi:hypothetical protein